jgi:hypothetical protein
MFVLILIGLFVICIISFLLILSLGDFFVLDLATDLLLEYPNDSVQAFGKLIIQCRKKEHKIEIKESITLHDKYYASYLLPENGAFTLICMVESDFSILFGEEKRQFNQVKKGTIIDMEFNETDKKWIIDIREQKYKIEKPIIDKPSNQEFLDELTSIIKPKLQDIFVSV